MCWFFIINQFDDHVDKTIDCTYVFAFRVSEWWKGVICTKKEAISVNYDKRHFVTNSIEFKFQHILSLQMLQEMLYKVS